VLFAQWDGTTLFFLCVVVGFLGEGATNLTNRMLAQKQRIRYWAVGLGIVTGIYFFFAGIPTRQAPTPDDLLGGIFAACLVGFCAGLVWYLAVAIITFAYQHVLSPPFEMLGRWRRNAAERSVRRREENLRWKQQRDYERTAPERARSAATLAAAKKRRKDARAACELLFHRHAHVLNGRFSRETLADFMQKYMGDGQTADEVEERGRQLQETILQHVHQIVPPKAPYTIESLADWYKTTKQVVDTLPVEDRYKQAQLAQLNARYAELMQSLMESLRP